MHKNYSFVFSLFIQYFHFRNKEETKLNKSAGQVLRSKESFNDEGGIVAGFGALDSPLLV